MIRRWILATSTMLATLAGCGVTELYIGFLPTTSTTSTTTDSTTTTTALCSPGEARSCYDGPAGTEGVGLCRAGTQACAEDGASWGACAGEVLPAPVEDCASGQDQDCDGHVVLCKGSLLWAERFGDGSDQIGKGVAVDSSGNVILTGYFTGVMDLGAGALTSASSWAPDVFVAKLDPSGYHLWSKRFGDAQNQLATSVSTDGDGTIAITGAINGAVDFGGGPLADNGSAIFIAKLDASGSHLWSKSFGSAGMGRSLATDRHGNIVTTGNFTYSVDFGGGALTAAGGYDLFIAKLDASGNHLWSKSFGDSDGQFGTGVAVDPDGNVVVTGYFKGAVDFGGGPLASTGGQDIFVAKLDASGNHLWSKSFGDAGDQQGLGIASDTSGNVVMTGFFSNTVDFGGGPLVGTGGQGIFVAKLDASGNHLWSKSFGDGTGAGVAVDGAGNVVVTGSFSGSVDFGGGPLASAGGPDVFVAKLDPSGAHVWSKRFGDAMDQNGTGIATDGAGNVLVTGALAGTVGFGSNVVLTGAGGADVFVAKLGP